MYKIYINEKSFNKYVDAKLLTKGNDGKYYCAGAEVVILKPLYPENIDVKKVEEKLNRKS